MKVRLLSPYPEEVLLPLVKAIVSSHDELDNDEYDFTVMWGYRHILKPAEIAGKRIINIHISYLPWNRGSQPNLWSWYDRTPKGVSIHHVTENVDAGPILAQRQIIFSDPTLTLRNSYEKLQDRAIKLFCEYWPSLRDYVPKNQSPIGEGSFHTTVDSMELMRHFTRGYDTPVLEIEEFGREQRRETSQNLR